MHNHIPLLGKEFALYSPNEFFDFVSSLYLEPRRKPSKITFAVLDRPKKATKKNPALPGLARLTHGTNIVQLQYSATKFISRESLENLAKELGVSPNDVHEFLLKKKFVVDTGTHSA